MTPTSISGVLDLSHFEDYADLEKAVSALPATHPDAVCAVIAKRTQGKDVVDPSDVEFMRQAKALDLERGEFHFGSNSESGEKQAQWFLDHRVDPDALIALDLEWQRAALNALRMRVATAEAFVSEIYRLTNCRPVVYTSRAYLTNGDHEGGIPAADSVLGQSPLWLCDYLHAEPILPLAPWHQWALHQYTNGIVTGPANALGLARMTLGLANGRAAGVDRSRFRGTRADLRAWWRSTSTPAPVV